MEDTFYINLANSICGPEELELLLKDWQDDPKPKTINELAREYLTNRIKADKGYLPYDRRRLYEIGDKIIIFEKDKYHPTQVKKILKDYSHDSEDFSYDAIDLVFLEQGATSEIRTFIANYQGEEMAGHVIRSFEIIKEKDEIEVIPKLLIALSNDKRFVVFREKWLPKDSLITEVSNKLNNVRNTIAKCKQALSTSSIIDKVFPCDNKEDMSNRLEFSLDYFLEKDKRFESLTKPDSVTRWDLTKPYSVQMTINKRFLSGSKLRISFDLEFLLFYHGFAERCIFSFPYNHEITAYYDISESTISGQEFFDELAKLSENKEYTVRFGHPKNRGDPICVLAPDEPKTIQSTVTIKQEWLVEGVLKVPKRLSIYMKGTNTVHILYDQVEEELPYDEGDRFIKGLHKFFSKKALDVYDKVQLQLESLRPTRLFIHSSWKVSLDKLLQIKPQDLDWEQSSVRDCIIVVLGKFKNPVHYREIYTEIAIHKHISWGTVLGTLSRNCPSVFVHVGSGQWQLTGLAETGILLEHGLKVQSQVIVISDEIWKAVATIEENDYVYKLLHKIKKPLSFYEICDKLADTLKIDVQELRATGFLKPDERLRRLDDGTWTLEEWFNRSVDEPTSGNAPKSNRFWIVLTILLIILYSTAAIILIRLFLYRS